MTATTPSPPRPSSPHRLTDDALVVSNTPFEVVEYDGRAVYVKREDLSAPPPGPGFSKMRGVVRHIQNRPETTIGVLDTLHSRGGWAVAQACRVLSRKAVVFYPEFKALPGPKESQIQAQQHGAHITALPAGRSAVLYHAAKKALAALPNSYMMPNALKLPESVIETSIEVESFTPARLLGGGTWVVSASSGTIAAGIARGLAQVGAAERVKLIVHLGYTRPERAVRLYLARMAGLTDVQCQIIDEGYAYRDAVDTPATAFPCSPFYDRKALHWLLTHYSTLTPPVVFWNVG